MRIEKPHWSTIVVILVCLLLFGFTDTIDTSLPGGSDDPAEADDNMRRIQGGFQEILAVEHNVDLTGTVITGDGTHTNITADSLDVTGNIDPTTYETTNGGFLDEDDMASDAADKVASEQSIKAFAEGNGYPPIDGTPTAVFTKYFTGTLDADSLTEVAHGITGIDNILHVSAAVFNAATVYLVNDFQGAASSTSRFDLSFDGTNVRIANVGSAIQSQKYRIKIDYVI